MNKQITIRMPKETLAKWLAALRSGDYRQEREVMHDGKDGYCCLGVLQHCVSGAIEEDEDEALPDKDWLRRSDVMFHGRAGDGTNNPFLPSMNMCAAAANDGGNSFAEIADAIEQCAEGI